MRTRAWALLLPACTAVGESDPDPYEGVWVTTLIDRDFDNGCDDAWAHDDEPHFVQIGHTAAGNRVVSAVFDVREDVELQVAPIADPWTFDVGTDGGGGTFTAEVVGEDLVGEWTFWTSTCSGVIGFDARLLHRYPEQDPERLAGSWLTATRSLQACGSEPAGPDLRSVETLEVGDDSAAFMDFAGTLDDGRFEGRMLFAADESNRADLDVAFDPEGGSGTLIWDYREIGDCYETPVLVERMIHTWGPR